MMPSKSRNITNEEIRTRAPQSLVFETGTACVSDCMNSFSPCVSFENQASAGFPDRPDPLTSGSTHASNERRRNRHVDGYFLQFLPLPGSRSKCSKFCKRFWARLRAGHGTKGFRQLARS